MPLSRRIPAEWYEGLVSSNNVAPGAAGLILEPIYGLFTSSLFPDDPNAKNANMLKAVNEYCEFLGPNVCTPNPEDAAPPPPPPIERVDLGTTLKGR